MQLGRSFIYKRVMAQQQKGGGWRVVRDVVKHPDGNVTNNIVESGLKRPEALRLTRTMNGARHG